MNKFLEQKRLEFGFIERDGFNAAVQLLWPCVEALKAFESKFNDDVNHVMALDERDKALKSIGELNGEETDRH